VLIDDRVQRSPRKLLILFQPIEHDLLLGSHAVPLGSGAVFKFCCSIAPHFKS
jgi:hypothetical protein